MAPSAMLNLPPGYVFAPKGCDLIEHYLVPMAFRGATIPGYVAEGVDVFSASPDALPFLPNHRREHEEVWGYFCAGRPVGERPQLAPGGCWLPYGHEKAYCFGNGGEAVAFRRRFAFHVMWRGLDGTEVWAQTRWLMKEYRLNKGAAAFRCMQPDPRSNMDCVVRKVFTKPVVPRPLPPPARSSDEESTGSNYPSADEEARYSVEQQARKRARFS